MHDGPIGRANDVREASAWRQGTDQVWSSATEECIPPSRRASVRVAATNKAVRPLATQAHREVRAQPKGPQVTCSEGR